MAIKLGIIGYGNLGRGVEAAVRQNPDMELEVVFTRRNPESVKDCDKIGESRKRCGRRGMERQARRRDSLRRKRDRPSRADSRIRKTFQRGRQLRHPRENSRTLRESGRVSPRGGESRRNFARLGPRTLFSQPHVRRRDSPRRQRLHFLGQGRKPGALRRRPQNCGR